jgi:hypothetical protein
MSLKLNSGTGISIAKVIQFGHGMRNLGDNRLYNSVSITTLSNTENAVCIIVACLPPLRLTFDNLLHKILPQSLLDNLGANSSGSQNCSLPTYRSHKNGERAEERFHDGESTDAIFGEEQYVEDENGKITMVTNKNTQTKGSC